MINLLGPEYQPMSILGMNVMASESIPEDQVVFGQDGKVVGSIINIGKVD